MVCNDRRRVKTANIGWCEFNDQQGLVRTNYRGDSRPRAGDL